MSSSEERREMAERLRREGRALTAIDMGVELASLTLDDAIGIEHNATWEECFNRLADLIDPTCHDFGGEEGTNGEGYDFACSACGYVCDLAEPKFCPNCGARVTSGRS